MKIETTGTIKKEQIKLILEKKFDIKISAITMEAEIVKILFEKRDGNNSMTGARPSPF